MLGKIFGKKQQTDNNQDVQEVVQAQDTQPTAPKKGIVGNLKDKAVEKMLERQMKGLPPAQREMLMKAIKDNPQFFEMIATKIKEEEKKNGGNQMAAAMKVMREHQGEMMKIMMGSK